MENVVLNKQGVGSVVETGNVVLLLHKSNPEHLKHALWIGQHLARLLVSSKSFDKEVTHLRVNEVLWPPLQLHKLLLAGQIEVKQAFEELVSLQTLKSSRRNKITFYQF